MKKILWKSEFWPYAKAFGAFTLFLLIFLLMHLVHHEIGEGFACAVVAVIPFILMVYLAFTPSETIKREWRPEIVEKAKQEALKNSFLNWENIPPNKRNPPPGMIG
jgi:protein-S-isoprenylcysteine O-methyltransferase Ste14